MLGRFCKSYILTISQNGSLAQLVEQRTLNPFVAGSIPARPTNNNKASRDGGLIYFCENRFDVTIMSPESSNTIHDVTCVIKG